MSSIALIRSMDWDAFVEIIRNLGFELYYNQTYLWKGNLQRKALAASKELKMVIAAESNSAYRIGKPNVEVLAKAWFYGTIHITHPSPDIELELTSLTHYMADEEWIPFILDVGAGDVLHDIDLLRSRGNFIDWLNPEVYKRLTQFTIDTQRKGLLGNYPTLSEAQLLTLTPNWVKDFTLREEKPEERARAIARSLLQDYIDRDYSLKYICWSVGGNLQSQLVEKGYRYDIYSAEERQSFVLEELQKLRRK